MVNISKLLREARRDAGLTQSDLAKQAGCTQSALSMFEMGKTTALSKETVQKLAELLGVELPQEPVKVVPAVVAAQGHHFCPNVQCLSNLPYFIGEELFLHPTGAAGEGHRCLLCGELLEERCPHCGALVKLLGGCCSECGKPLVEVPDGLFEGADAKAWASGQAQALAALRKACGGLAPLLPPFGG